MSLCDGHTTVWTAQERHLCLGRGTEEKQSRAMGRECAAWHHRAALGGAHWPRSQVILTKLPEQQLSCLPCNSLSPLQREERVYCPCECHHSSQTLANSAQVVLPLCQEWCLEWQDEHRGCCPCTPSLTTPCSLLFKWKKYHLFWEDLWVTCHKSTVYEPCSSWFNVKIQHLGSQCFQHYGCGRE